MPDTTWTFTDDTETVTVDGINGDDRPVITVGEEVDIEIILENNGASGDHLSVYKKFIEYDRFLNDKALDYGNDYRGQPYYRTEFHPAADITTYLFEVQPGDDTEGYFDFWGILVGVEDNSNLVGAGEKLQLTFFVLAETNEFGTRTNVESTLKAEL